MNDKTLTIGDAGSLLIGAGLTKLDNVTLALALIGAGVALKITVAILQKQGVPVESPRAGQ